MLLIRGEAIRLAEWKENKVCMRRKKERGRGVRGRQGGAGGYNRSGTQARSKQIIHQMLDDKNKKETKE